MDSAKPLSKSPLPKKTLPKKSESKVPEPKKRLAKKPAKAPSPQKPPESAEQTAFRIGEGRVIALRGAREHNLKNVDLTIPRDKLVVFTGLSGSGKSCSPSTRSMPRASGVMSKACRRTRDSFWS